MALSEDQQLNICRLIYDDGLDCLMFSATASSIDDEEFREALVAYREARDKLYTLTDWKKNEVVISQEYDEEMDDEDEDWDDDEDDDWDDIDDDDDDIIGEDWVDEDDDTEEYEDY